MDGMRADPPTGQLPTIAAEVAPFRLEDWLVEPSLNRLTRDGHVETIEPRMMHVLVCLAAVPGEVVSRRDLLDVVWGDAVVGEEVLTRAISRLRIVLGDDRRQVRFVETIRGGGYRLLSLPVPAARHAGRRAWYRSTGLRLGALLVLVVLAAWATGRFKLRREVFEAPVAVPVTTLPGNEFHPAMSPDGVTVVFGWSGDGDEGPGLFAKQVTGGEARRLTSPAGMDLRPAFSPDGARVAFVRQEKSGIGIRTVPALGGATRLLAEIPETVFGLSWSPLGDHLVFASRDTASGQSCLLRLDLDGLGISPLTSVDTETHTGDSWPAHAPDGQSIAFARCDHAGLREIWLVPATGGRGRQVTEGLNDCQGIAWLPGGDGLVVGAPVLGKTGLWRVDMPGGEVSSLRLVAQGRNTNPALAADGSVLVFRNLQVDLDLKRLTPGGETGETVLDSFSPSTRREYQAAWSPDAGRVAFVSDRSGEPALWLARPDGSHSRQVVAWPEVEIRNLFWAPDNRRLAVNLIAAQRAWIEIVDTETGLSRPLGDAPGHERSCGWSLEDGTISLLRDEGESWRLYRASVEGGPEMPCGLELAGHAKVRATPLGHIYEAPDRGGLWLLPGQGQPPRQLVAAGGMAGWRTWQYAATGLHILRGDGAGGVLVETLDPATGARRRLAEVPADTRGLAVSADGESLLLTILTEVRSDLLQVPGTVASLR